METHMGDTNHVQPKVVHVHVEQHSCFTREDFWAGMFAHGCCTRGDFWAGMFADFDWIRWCLLAWGADNRRSAAAAGCEHYSECMCVRLFGSWGLFV